MVYTPRWTDLLGAAREAGATVVSGLSMLVYQGARAFELWTGRPAPVEVMKRAVDAAIPDRG
jgi:shikimate dehydrogenase